MKEAKIKAKVEIDRNSRDLNFEFGRVQGDMWLSLTGTIARHMKFKHGDEVEIIIRKK